MIDTSEISDEIRKRARKVKLLLMDCDGVLTDGRLYFTEMGEAMKVFHVRDGQGLALWHQAGFRSGIITGRNTEKILQSRVKELGIHYLKVCSQDKERDFIEILHSEGITADEVAYIGDDIGDICLMKLVGFPIAVADAIINLDQYTIHKTKNNGGQGAVREITDLLLKVKNK